VWSVLSRMDVSTGEGGKANRCRPDVHATWRREKQFLNSLDDKRLHPALLTASSHTQTPYTSATVIISPPVKQKNRNHSYPARTYKWWAWKKQSTTKTAVSAPSRTTKCLQQTPLGLVSFFSDCCSIFDLKFKTNALKLNVD